MFKDLEERFNTKISEIYGKYSLKTAPETQPYIEVKPNDPGASDALKDSRSQTGESGRRDIRRQSGFITSQDGKTFFNLEKVLQTGNTFSETGRIEFAP